VYATKEHQMGSKITAKQRMDTATVIVKQLRALVKKSDKKMWVIAQEAGISSATLEGMMYYDKPNITMATLQGVHIAVTGRLPKLVEFSTDVD